MSSQHPHITIITPCYNEGVVVIRFLESLEHALSSLAYRFSIVVVNDGSTDNTLTLLKDYRFKAANLSLDVVSREYNGGHQAAIYEGLVYAQYLDSDHFIVMDCDGQDAPATIPELLAHKNADIVHAVRGKRNESILFRLCYRAYKAIFRMLTGKRMNFGNFCVINRTILERAVELSFTHFPAFLSKQEGVAKSIVVERGRRIGGQSKMGFRKLFYHAVTSFTEYRNDAPVLKRLS